MENIRKGILLDSNNQVVSYVECRPKEDFPRGFIEIGKMPEKEIGDYKYENGQFIYNPRKDYMKLRDTAFEDIMESVLDLQIRTSTLELSADSE